MKHLILALQLCLAVLATTHTLEVNAEEYQQKDIPADLQKKFEEARDRRVHGDLAGAIVSLEKIVQAKPDYYMANFNLALAYTDDKQYEKGIRVFDETLKLQKQKSIEDYTLQNSAGWANLLAGQYTRSEQLLLEAKEKWKTLPPDSQRKVFNNLGVLYLSEDDRVKAKENFIRARDLGSDLAKLKLAGLESESRDKMTADDIKRAISDHHGIKDVYLIPNIPKKKLDNATHAMRLPHDDETVALVDATLQGTATDGMIFGHKGIYFHTSSLVNDSQQGFIAYSEFPDRDFREVKNHDVSLDHGQHFNTSTTDLNSGQISDILNTIRKVVIERRKGNQ